MIAYCGLDCGKCNAYPATINDDQALREKTAKRWAELNNAPILPEYINCEGCCVDGIKTVFFESLCGIRQCALKKDVTACGGCPDMERCQIVYETTSNYLETLDNLTTFVFIEDNTNEIIFALEDGEEVGLLASLVQQH